MGDSEDEIETMAISKVAWLKPVRDKHDLPKEGVKNGTMCYVEGDLTGEEEVWEFQDGTWFRVD